LAFKIATDPFVGRLCFFRVYSGTLKAGEMVLNVSTGKRERIAKIVQMHANKQLPLDEISAGDIGAAVGFKLIRTGDTLCVENKPLVLDRTRLFYTLIADIKDGEATVKMTRIHYLYDEEREPTPYKAEEWITDEEGLTKKRNKLSRVSGKFRRKTIDRKDYLFNKFAEILK
jgi:hypothetical protein